MDFYEECEELIASNGEWKGNLSSFYPLSNDLDNVSKALSNWGRNLNSQRKSRIMECKKSRSL